MLTFIIPVVLIILLSLYSFYSYKKTKQYYTEEKDTILQESKELKDQIIGIITPVHPKMEDRFLVNGHYAKQVQVGVKITTYYSYMLLVSSEHHLIQVISYDNKKRTAQDLGDFKFQNIEAVDIKDGFNTNLIFKDENEKELFVVQLSGHDLPIESDYATKYFQEVEYNKLRQCFHLLPYSHDDQLNGGQK